MCFRDAKNSIIARPLGMLLIGTARQIGEVHLGTAYLSAARPCFKATSHTSCLLGLGRARARVPAENGGKDTVRRDVINFGCILLRDGI